MSFEYQTETVYSLERSSYREFITYGTEWGKTKNLLIIITVAALEMAEQPERWKEQS